MKKRFSGMKMFFCALFFLVSVLGTAAFAEGDAVNVILKNDSGGAVEVELVDQYGGNFKVTVDSGTSQNQTLKVQSEILVAGNAVHTVVPEDEGMEVVIAS